MSTPASIWDQRELLTMTGPGIGVISAAGARLLVRALDVAFAQAARDGIRPPDLARMRATAEAIAADDGHPDARREADQSALPHGDDAIDTATAAELLDGCSVEHVRRLANAGRLGPALRQRRQWVLSRPHVVLYAELRRQQPERTAS